MLICEMAAYYRSIGSSLKQRLEEIYAQYGRYLNKVDSFEFPGLSGMDKMASIMENLRKNPLTEVAGIKVASVTDYTQTGRNRTSFCECTDLQNWKMARLLLFVLQEQSRRLRSITQHLEKIWKKHRQRKTNSQKH